MSAACVHFANVHREFQPPPMPPNYRSSLVVALDRSGENRGELTKALAQTSQVRSPAMCDMISRMPNYDLANITADVLLDHIDCTFAANDQVTWELYPNSDLFLDEVLPYRVSCESLENSRRDIRRMAFSNIVGRSNGQASGYEAGSSH
jgi:hypothetical protein